MTSSDPADNQKKEASPALDQAATTPELVEKTLDSAGGDSGAFMAGSKGAMIIVSPNAPEHLVGTIFDGKYEILCLLGQGGMSAVFKAKNLVLHRIVAIKILVGNRNLDEQSLMRFQQEARAASQLDHPNIVKVHDFSVAIDHAPYMVMDHVEGKSIAEIIAAEGQMDAYRAIDLILQACSALEHAHDQGVVHRDLKPSNIMVAQLKDGREIAKIVDFGVAKLLEEEQAATPQLTRTGEVFGSPLYMSPEQCLGKKVDARCDIYSLACVLFEELTGAPPFRAENVLATMHMHINDAPPELTKIRSDLHNGARLSSILLTALSKNPEQRFNSMKAFAAALKEAALRPQAGIFRRLATHMNIFRKTQESNRHLPILIVT
ncbi:MAG: serine/threonine protein kinase, partial [Candidatus Melainabacteria bacterium]|nr:serine/threonine protein kinase [Candidatus Melainabacteria bacterium]